MLGPTRLLTLLLVLGHNLALAAEPVYVIDKLLVGVHEDKDLDSAIIKVLPTGTKLEVLARDGELAQVVDPDRVKGWVDAAYLTDEPPAELRLTTLVAEKAALEARLEKLEQNPAATSAANAAADPGDNTQVDALTKENTALKGKLSDERLRLGQLQSEVATLRAEVSNAAAPPDARVLELERTRDTLDDELGAARDRLAEYEARASLSDTAALVPLVVRDYLTWIMLALALIAVLAFGGGMYVVDLMNRRRHGGFRV